MVFVSCYITIFKKKHKKLNALSVWHSNLLLVVFEVEIFKKINIKKKFFLLQLHYKSCNVRGRKNKIKIYCLCTKDRIDMAPSFEKDFRRTELVIMVSERKSVIRSR